MSNTFKVPSGITRVASDCNIHSFRVDNNGMMVVWAPFQQGTNAQYTELSSVGLSAKTTAI